VREYLIEYRSASPEQTEAFGARLATALPSRDDAPAILYLAGDLGSGKTTLARGFIHGLGIVDEVRSPTFALLEPYAGETRSVLHLDLYRLLDPAELEALGLRDWAQPHMVWLIEWPERGGTRLPEADVRVVLSVADRTHGICASAVTPFGRAWLMRANTA
jgi:tRNA threonylcarbamoyladenosine biosynthesis protein TsaE